MVMIKIHETLELGLNAKKLGIEMPGRARLDLHREGANGLDARVALPKLSLKSDRLKDSFFLLERDTEGEIEVGMDLMLFHDVQAIHQGLIGEGMAFVDLSGSNGTDIGGEDDEGFGARKGLLERFDKIGCWKSKGFKDAFHLDLLVPDASK